MLLSVFRGMCVLGSVAIVWGMFWGQRAAAENWPRFRGENGTGISTLQGLPATWSPGDYAWNIELPGVGHASPTIWEDTLFVTSAEDEGAVRHLFCLDAVSGEQKWSRTIGMNRSHKHLKSSWASSSPATDGERVYVFFADKERYLVSAYDFDGELVWRRDLGSFESQHGLGVSPIVFEDMVIVANDQDGPSSIVALDCRTGETRWSVLRSIAVTSYATPMVLRLEGRKPQLICVSGAMGVTSLDPYTGTLNWKSGEFPLRTVASPIYAGGVLIASCGKGGSYGVLLRAVDPTGEGDGAKRLRYERPRELPYVPTPIAYEDHLYLWNDNGVVCCVEAATGKTVWTKRVGGNYSASPLCVGGKLYGVSEQGEVTVVAASPEYKFYGTTSLGEASNATPSVARGRLYLRTYHRLACLEAQP